MGVEYKATGDFKHNVKPDLYWQLLEKGFRLGQRLSVEYTKQYIPRKPLGSLREKFKVTLLTYEQFFAHLMSLNLNDCWRSFETITDTK